MKKFIFFSTILFSLIYITAKSQPTNNLIGGVVTPPPNVGSLGKFIDIPVNLAQGVPQIGIPIYNLAEGPLSLPISLDYHASGIRVAELASWVGIGWNLRAGGMVSRTVMGIPDEGSAGLYWTARGLNNIYPQTPSETTSFNVVNNYQDGEADIFSFSLPGYSGKFYIKENEVVLVPRQDLKITFNDNNTITSVTPEEDRLQRFTIVTPEGTKYYFGTAPGETSDAIEFINRADQTESINKFPVSWKLMKIESADGKNDLEFYYESEKYEYISRSSSSYTKFIIDDSSCNCTVDLNQASTSNFGNYGIRHFGKRLRWIKSDIETITFNASIDREDTEPISGENAKRLENIQIFAGQPTLCKQFSFSYDYFEATPGTQQYYEKRLRLLSLQESSCNGQVSDIPPYTFEYNGDFLPSLLSLAVDHWGFYNGKEAENANPDHQVNIPPTTLTVNPNYADVTLGHADRETDETAMKKGVLTKINYPTSGYTQFDFEANSYHDPSTNLIRENKVNITNPCLQQDIPSTPTTFNLSDDYTYEIELHPGGVSAGCPSQGNFTATIELYAGTSLGTATYISSYQLNEYLSYDDSDPDNDEYFESFDLFNIFPGLQNGTDYIFVIPEKTAIENNLTVEFRVYREYNETITNRKVGGLRIKEVVQHDGIDPMNNVLRSYQYLDADGSQASSGFLYREPEYGYKFTKTAYLTQQGFPFPFYALNFNENSIIPLSTFDGYHIYYERVVEKLHGSGDKEYTFKPPITSQPGPTPAYPFAPEPVQLRAGKLITSKVRKENTLEVVSQTTNSSNDIPDYVDNYNLKVAPYVLTGTISDALNTTSFDDIEYSNSVYRNNTGFHRLTSTQASLDGVETTTNFGYDSFNNHLMPVEEEMIYSQNKKFRTRYLYPFDTGEFSDTEIGITVDASVYQEMVDRNMISTPIEVVKEVEIGGSWQITGGSHHQFTFFDGSGNPTTANNTAPYLYKIFGHEISWDESGVKSDDNWTLDATIETYDMIVGKPKQVLQRGWGPEVLSWDASNKLITERRFKPSETAPVSEHFVWAYSYHSGTGLIDRITDVDGQFIEYDFDPALRLKTISAKTGNVTTNFGYHYKTTPGTHNYISSATEYVSSGANSALSNRTTNQYFDGLGRLIQTVEQGYSEAGNDVVAVQAFDPQGRVFKTYEVFEGSGSSGAFDNRDLTSEENYPFTLTEYEPTPLGRQTGITPPDWYQTKTTYGKNTAAITVPGGDSYGIGDLNRVEIQDPNGNRSFTYTDRRGRVVLNEQTTVSFSSFAKTYQIYDDKDRLRTIIPPQATINDEDLIYNYLYDGRNNLIYKKIPGQGATHYLYDERDLATYLQDANMADAGNWLHTQYDLYGRAITSGFVGGSRSDGNIESEFSTILTKTCYDGCDFAEGAPAIYKGKVRRSETLILGTNDWLKNLTFYDAHGRVSKTEANHHLNIGNLQSETIQYAYDYADNLLSSNRVHSLPGGTTTSILEESHFDHSGRLLAAYHQIDGGTKVQISELKYTPKDQIREKNLGKVGTSFLQSVDYYYLDNGFLDRINEINLGGTNIALPGCTATLPNPGPASSTPDDNDLFYLDLNYDQNETGIDHTSQRNGNIAQIIWRIRGRERQAYGFNYDFLDRLSEANYYDITDGDVKSTSNRFGVDLTYADARGNIGTITRQGQYWDGSCWQIGQIDQLTYSYEANSNRLRDVDDTASGTSGLEGYKPYTTTATGADYTYDLNGNLTYDPSKELTITYNYLNLPQRIEDADCKVLEFTYDAVGMKLRKTVKDGAVTITTQDYVGGIEYRGGVMEAIYHTEGRVYFEDGSSRYEYNLTDHLGNTRLMFSDKNGNGIVDMSDDPETTEVLQENHYYPFGMQMKGSWMENPGRESKYQFNGIERNKDLGLNWDLADFRSYDANIGRWTQIDPLAEFAPDVTSYRFGFNNPILYVDPFGLFETKQEAIDYAKEHGLKRGWFNSNIKEQSDGTWSIENKKDHSSTERDSELGVIKSALATAPKDGYNQGGNLAFSAERREPYSGFWGNVNYFLTGGNENGLKYNRDGYPLHISYKGGAGAIALIGGGQGIPSAAQMFSEGSRTVQHIRGNLYVARSGAWLNPSGKVSYAGGFISAESKLISTTSKYDFKPYAIWLEPLVRPNITAKSKWKYIMDLFGRGGQYADDFIR